MSDRIDLVTGATGLVGNAVAKSLAAAGASRVRALVRDPDRARSLLPAGIELVRGDITDRASVDAAMRGAARVFHAAGMPEQWQPDESVFGRVNTGGTVHVLESALAEGVRRVVYTSTMDVFAAKTGGTLDERAIDPAPKPTAYERSKQSAEREAEKIAARGLDVVYVNPSAVYGAGPVHVGMNSFFIRLLNGKMPLVPPGGCSVCYVDAVASAHVAAAERGRPRERYLLADAHVSGHELAVVVVRRAGAAGSVPRTAPAWLFRALAAASAPLARTFGLTPLVAPGQASFMLWDARVDASKAKRELGYTPLALEEGVDRTIACLREAELVPPA